MISKVRQHITQNEPLLFERSSPGKKGYQLPPLDVPAVSAAEALGASNVRSHIEGFPEVSEVEVIRHFTRLSTWNYAIDLGLYPLGSCTMKYNPRLNEYVARLEGLALAHPYQPEALSQGCMRIQHLLESFLTEITGMDAVTLQPAAGAHGWFARGWSRRAIRGGKFWCLIRLTAQTLLRPRSPATKWKKYPPTSAAWSTSASSTGMSMTRWPR
jgi:glycine dehydrogenase subunit 2